MRRANAGQSFPARFHVQDPIQVVAVAGRFHAVAGRFHLVVAVAGRFHSRVGHKLSL